MPGDREDRVSCGRDLSWRLEALGMRLLFGGLRLMGVEGASNFGGWVLRTLGPRTGTRKTVDRNLRIAFPDMTPDQRTELAGRVWEQVGRTFAEAAVSDKLTRANGRVEIVGEERFREIRESGRPVIFISGHFANFELMAATVLSMGIKTQVAYRATNNPYVEKQVRKYRARYGVTLFAPKGTEGAKGILEGMARGDSVAMLVDQKFAEGPEVMFFGQPVNAVPGPARLAMRFGAELQPLSVERLPGVRFRLTAHEPIPVASTGNRTEDIRTTVQAISDFLEEQVRARPEDWFWVHRRWPDKVYAALDSDSRSTELPPPDESVERRNGPA